jgi:thiol:disulfide interchange protein DsbD
MSGAIRLTQLAFLLSPCIWGLSAAQVQNQTVKWAASVISTAAAKSGGNATLEVSAQVREGWHVYALTQPPGGPTALRITIDQSEAAQVTGPASGTVPEKRHDPSFDLETQFYTHAFALRLPLHVTQQASAGRRQVIPVSVRFQTCSDRECQPPTTVHLSVPVEAVPDAT